MKNHSSSIIGEYNAGQIINERTKYHNLKNVATL